DGTINLVGGALLGKMVPLGIIPLGSANGMATELLIPKDVAGSVQVLLEGKIIDMDVLEVNKEHLCFHLADVGFNAKLIQQFDEAPGRGKLTYLWGFLKTIWQKEGVRTLIQTPNRQLKQSIEMITFANATKYGTGALINPQGKIDDGQFEACIFKPYPRWEIPHLTWLFFTGKLDNSRHIRILSTAEIEVVLARAQPLQIDGEVVGEVKKVTVKVHPEKVPVLVPQAYGE
ncbi:MAG: diacylglycerol/lipid kinase family protein, partial [Saprospiraceae bacterium]